MNSPFFFMLYLTLDSDTTVYVEANDLNTSGYYLFRVVDDVKNEYISYISAVTTNDRYVEFSITLPDDFNITSTGDYVCYVYNGDNSSIVYGDFDLLGVYKMRVDE